MFIAMDNNQKRWNCMEEIPAVTEGPFYCLACHSPVRLKNGSVLRAHFAHVELQHCPYHHEAESFEHLELKASLYDWASKESHTEVESYLADFQQIADLLVVDKNLALEVQCSSLSLERLKERSDAYRSHGYQVYWLLGKKLWLKERLTKLQAGFLYFSQNRGFHLWELDLEKKEVRLQYLIHEGAIALSNRSFPFWPKVFTGSLTDPLSFTTHAANGSRARSYIFNVYPAATLLSSPKVAEASGRTLFAGKPSDGTGAGFLLSSLSSDPFTELASN